MHVYTNLNKLDDIIKVLNNYRPKIQFIYNKKFSQKLKFADITPLYKKEDSTKMKNYIAVSVLPIVSKIFERLIQKQISEYIKQFRLLFSVVTQKDQVFKLL